MRLTDRGVLKAGMWADILVFDPATVRDVATFENPNQLSQGMQYVLVNGVPVIDEGKMTGALPGKVLRGAGYVGKSDWGLVLTNNRFLTINNYFCLLVSLCSRTFALWMR